MNLSWPSVCFSVDVATLTRQPLAGLREIRFNRDSLRRLLSILLLACFGLPLAAPLLALSASASPDAGLPACCRRAGKHHCAMSMAERSRLADHEPGFSASRELCPCAPQSVASVHVVTTGAPSQWTIATPLMSYSASIAQTECKCRIARDRSRQKRGPPASSVS